MLNLLFLRSGVAVLLIGLALLAGGCGCGREDDYPALPPRFSLAFSTDTAASGAGFRRAEVRSAYLVRYAAGDFQQVLDTLRQRPTTATANVFNVYYISSNPPQFEVMDYVRQNVFARSFRLVVPAANRTYDIANLVTERKSSGGRCPVNQTTRLEATVNGQRRDALGQLPLLTK